jgi:hypothetical protein
MRFATKLAIVTALASGTAIAGKIGNVTLPDTISVHGKQLVLNGMGLREATMLKVDVYVAGLYLETPSADPAQIVQSNQTKRLVLRFVRDVDRKDIVKAWSEGFRKNATVPEAQLRDRIEQLNSWMPAFKNGSTLVFTYTPGEGVVVEVDNQRKGVLQGDDFAQSLFAIWLGQHPPTSDVKKGLLGRR